MFKNSSGTPPTGETGPTIIYFDCYSGISGDMALGALLDGGADLKELRAVLAGLKLQGWSLGAEKIKRGGIAGTRALVCLDGVETAERHLNEILEILDRADLPRPVGANSRAVFERLAEAEAAVHGISVDQVHFHEVGAGGGMPSSTSWAPAPPSTCCRRTASYAPPYPPAAGK